MHGWVVITALFVGCPSPGPGTPTPVPSVAQTADTAQTPTGDTAEPFVEPHAVELLDLDGVQRTAFNIGVAAADDEVWFAVEHSVFVLGRADVELVRWNGSILQRKNISELRLTPLTGHYPDILVRDGDDFVQVLTKQNVLQERPQLELHRQSRADFGSDPIVEELDPPDLGLRFGRAHIDRDPVLGAEHVCATAFDAEPQQDVFMKTRSGTDLWESRPLEPLDDAPGVQDHCDFVFQPDGSRISVLHSEPDSHAIVLRLERLSGGTWGQATRIELPLPGPHAGANYPAIAASGDRLMVSAASESVRDELLIWECASDCGDVSQWRVTTLNPPGPRHRQPRVVLARGHAFLAWETDEDTSPTPTLWLASQCRGEGWKMRGMLELPDGYSGARQAFGSIPGASVRTLIEHRGVLHAGYLVQRLGGAGRWNAAWWSASMAAYCPGGSTAR